MNCKELAAAIRKGAAITGEGKFFMTNADRQPPEDANCCCALGAAWLGSGLTEEDYWEKNNGVIDAFFQTLNIPKSRAEEINIKHCGGMPRLAIADWLDTLEPETSQKDAQSFDDFKRLMLAPVETDVSISA